MAVIGDLVARLSADTRDFDRGMKSSRGSLASFAGFAKGAVAGLVAGVGVGGLALMGKSALSAAADYERAAVSFEVLTGSAAAGQKVLSDLSGFAASTPFELPELQSAATKLLAFGTASEDIIPTLTSIGDISSAIGAPISEIAEIYGKAQVQGRLFMEDINQLTGRGIPIIGELAKQFGVAESEVRELVSSGKVTFENLEQGFRNLTGEGGQFAGMMERQSQTLSGKWSSFKDQITALAREFGQVLLPAAKATLDFITPAIDQIIASVQSFGEAASFTFRNFSDIAKVALLDLQLAMFELIPGSEQASQGIATNLSAAFAAIEVGATSWFTNIIGSLKEIGNVAVAVADGIVAAFEAAMAGENPLEAFTKTFISEFAKQEDVASGGNPLTKMAETFKKTRQQIREGFESGGGLGDMLRAEREALLSQIGQREAARNATKEEAAGATQDGSASGGAGGKSPVTAKLSEALAKGSSSALSAINKAMTGGKSPMNEVAKTTQQQLAEDKKMVAELKRLARKTAPTIFTV